MLSAIRIGNFQFLKGMIDKIFKEYAERIVEGIGKIIIWSIFKYMKEEIPSGISNKKNDAFKIF